MVVCFTGGGTLGHVYPALAVHEALRGEVGYEAFFIGRSDAGERAAAERAGLAFYAIPSGKLRRYRSAKNLASPLFVIAGFFKALFILIKLHPDVLFSKGGFVTPPVVLAAWILKIPVISHESDTTAGLATTINSRFSQILCTPIEGGFDHLGAKRVVVTGSPIRSSLLSYEQGSIPLPFLGEGERLLLILGGSGGSSQINDLVHTTLDALVAHAYVYHQSGPGKVAGITHPRYTEVEFIDDLLPALLERADLVVCRAGANTIAELALFAAPALLIPLSASYSRGDQVENAKVLAQRGAARVLLQEIDSETFVAEVSSLLADIGARRAYSQAIGTLAQRASASLIATLVREQGMRRQVCSGE